MIPKLIILLVSTILLSMFIKSVESLRGLISRGPRYYYCQLESCSNPQRHVKCLYRNTSIIHERCHYHVRSGLSTEEKNDTLKEHMSIRKEFGSRKGINFPEIMWDHDLEEMAHIWANQCSKNNDECRSILDNGYVVKQNIGYYQVTGENAKFKFNVINVVKDWAQIPFNPANPAVWKYRDVNRIGCGLTVKSENEWRNIPCNTLNTRPCANHFHIYFVCNYGISQVLCHK